MFARQVLHNIICVHSHNLHRKRLQAPIHMCDYTGAQVTVSLSLAHPDYEQGTQSACQTESRDVVVYLNKCCKTSPIKATIHPNNLPSNSVSICLIPVRNYSQKVAWGECTTASNLSTSSFPFLWCTLFRGVVCWREPLQWVFI